MPEVGPSPRGRGNLDASWAAGSIGGSIPAWAGKPNRGGGGGGLYGVHPRVDGETRRSSPMIRSGGGPSPRGRGNRRSASVHSPHGGSIPAWAGKPFSRRLPSGLRRVHPRVGGETAGWVAQALRCHGPSPRGRGNPRHLRTQPLDMRSIPAWAGKPMPCRRRSRSSEVHPRVGGETAGEVGSNVKRNGPSPRGRGNPSTMRTISALLRSIPAWAGKPRQGPPSALGRRVHPRVGGETEGIAF